MPSLLQVAAEITAVYPPIVLLLKRTGKEERRQFHGIVSSKVLILSGDMLPEFISFLLLSERNGRKLRLCGSDGRREAPVVQPIR